MLFYIQQAIYIYGAAAFCVCLFGWLFEKLSVFPHAVHFSARVGRCSCFALGTVILAVAVSPILSAGLPAYQEAIETGTIAVAVFAVWYSLIHIHASYVQINVMWKAFKRLESHVLSHITDLDREHYVAYVEELRADDLFSYVDPQYHELYDNETVKLAMYLGLM